LTGRVEDQPGETPGYCRQCWLRGFPDNARGTRRRVSGPLPATHPTPQPDRVVCRSRPPGRQPGGRRCPGGLSTGQCSHRDDGSVKHQRRETKDSPDAGFRPPEPAALTDGHAGERQQRRGDRRKAQPGRQHVVAAQRQSGRRRQQTPAQRGEPRASDTPDGARERQAHVDDSYATQVRHGVGSATPAVSGYTAVIVRVERLTCASKSSLLWFASSD
jgi:hypothetical protein